MNSPSILKKSFDFRYLIESLSFHFGIIILVAIAGSCGIFIAISNPKAVNNDDAYIFFRYALHFVNEGEISYNLGEPSYGFTSFAWMFLLGYSLKIMEMNIITIAQSYAIIFFCFSIYFLYLLAYRLSNRTRWLSLSISTAYACDRFMQSQVFSGMESIMGVCVYLGFLWLCLENDKKWLYVTGIIMGMMLLIRPDFIVFVGAYFVFDLIRQRLERNQYLNQMFCSWFRMLVVVAIILLPCFLFMRYKTGFFVSPAYIGKILTNHPEYFKKDMPQRMNIGVKALGNLIRKLSIDAKLKPFGIIMFLGMGVYLLPLLFELKYNRFHFLALPYLGVIGHFLLFIWMYPCPEWRYHLIMFPIAYLSFGLGAQAVGTFLGETQRSFNMFIGYSVLIAISFWSVFQSSICLTNPKQTNENLNPVIEWINQNIDQKSLVAFDMIGALGYLTHVRYFDMGGLIQSDIWPCLQNKKNIELLIGVFKSKGVDYFMTYDKHIMWNFLPSQMANLILVKRIPVDSDSVHCFRIFKIDYSKEVTIHPAEKSTNQQMSFALGSNQLHLNE